MLTTIIIVGILLLMGIADWIVDRLNDYYAHKERMRDREQEKDEQNDISIY